MQPTDRLGHSPLSTIREEMEPVHTAARTPSGLSSSRQHK